MKCPAVGTDSERVELPPVDLTDFLDLPFGEQNVPLATALGSVDLAVLNQVSIYFSAASFFSSLVVRPSSSRISSSGW